MKIRISAAILAFTLIFSLFTACKNEPEPEPASQYSDEEAAQVKENFSHIDSQLNLAESATAAENPSDFKAAVENSESDIASYSGTEDISVAMGSKIEKTVAIDTTGSVSIGSEMSSVVITRADGGFSANAKIDSIVFQGTDITADITSETGSIYVKGKNITINVRNSAVEKIFVNNIYTTINNITDTEIHVTLTNGSKVRVPAQTTYNAINNTIQKYTPAE